MTPDLKIACELIFQEHKMSGQPIKWDRDAFRGRVSFGLSEMAKETLVKKKIILLPDKSKKVFTQLNPDVADASSFEEAEKIVGTKIPGQVITTTYEAKSFIANHVADSTVVSISNHSTQLAPVAPVPEASAAEIKWWMKPFYLYVVWPVCGAVAGVLISLLMDFVFTKLF